MVRGVGIAIFISFHHSNNSLWISLLGTFSERFLTAGTYFFTSGPVFVSDPFEFSGVIHVHVKEALEANISVTVNGAEAALGGMYKGPR